VSAAGGPPWASPERLYELLPAVYRIRDAELGHPLRDLVTALAEQALLVESDVERLYEDAFIETCRPWVVPYVGDLIGVRGLRETGFTHRAEVANTLGYRRRKGTAAVLEDLARAVTGWPARVVEYFELLGWTQNDDHVVLDLHGTASLRDADALELVDGPFDRTAHTADVRRIEPRRGRHGIPHVGLHLWRLAAYPLAGVTARSADATGLHFHFSPLGNDTPLFHHPEAETGPEHVAGEIHVPAPLRRRRVRAAAEDYYGPGRSLLVARDGVEVDRPEIRICNLAGWAHEPAAGEVAVDPELGRIAFASGEGPDEPVTVTYHHGFSADLGGGQYERAASLTEVEGALDLAVGAGRPFATVGAALADWVAVGPDRPGAVITIHDSATYEETLAAAVPAGRRLEVRAANEERPTLRLGGELVVDGGDGSAFELDGLLVEGHPLRVTGTLDRLRLRHAPLGPGLALGEDGAPASPGAPSLVVESPNAEVVVERSILGAIRVARETELTLRDAIVDAHDPAAPAFAGLAAGEPGGALVALRVTFFGNVACRVLELGDATIFLGSVTAERRQEGCVRFSWVAPGSRVPRRFRCQPAVPSGATAAEAARTADRTRPRFTSRSYGDPGYAQLHRATAPEVLRGAEDGSEMGAFSHLMQPQREDNLRIRLDEYLRLGLEAGIFFVT